MRSIRASSLAAALLVLAACSSAPAPETDEQRGSYALGMDVGRQVSNSIQQMGGGVDIAQLMQGFQDVLEERGLAMTEEEAAQARQTFLAAARERADQERTELAARNLSEGQAFLEENGRREGVVTTESGLQYEVLEPGDGAMPTATDRVTVHYVGTLIDGTQFDSSYDRGQPATFAVRGVISGWTEALQLMPVGSKYKLYVPGNLGYGEPGRGATIGPNATLIFEVELLEIAGA